MLLIEIKKIEEILLVDKPLLRHKISSLAAPAENNGSFLAYVELRLKNEKNFEEKFELVAKLIPPNVNSQKLESFKNEIVFYKTIVPQLQDFLKLQDAGPIEFFPKYYGGRLTLNSKIKEADRDAVFFLENLEASGFVTPQPHVGLNLETTKLILKVLSKFHASFLAVRLKKPEIFKHKVKPHVNPNDTHDNNLVNETKQIVSLMWENEACVSLVPRVRKAMSHKKSSHREPFATIIHNDFWTNNIMVKMKGDKPEEIKILDFQKITYGSPATDLIFFLFSSVEESVLQDNFDKLITYYYDNLTSALQDFNCDISTLSPVVLLNEIDVEAKIQFPHMIAKLNSIFTSQYTEEHKEKAWFIVQEFAKRNWI